MQSLQNSSSIAWFISSHGFGHAARSCAIMAAWRRQNPQLHFHLYTQTPRWFFDEALQDGFTYHTWQSDVGLVQTTPMTQNLPLTRQQLTAFLQQTQTDQVQLAGQLTRLGIKLVVADVSPLGILSARRADIPSVLIENFTWDWIYEIYQPESPQWAELIHQIQTINTLADFHIQTEPVCNMVPNAALLAPPASREPRKSAAQTRAELNIPADARLVLVTMGGIPEVFAHLDRIRAPREVYYVIPGGSQTYEKHDHTLLIPHHSRFYHPDLIHACDVVIGKAGYSTIAEVYRSGAPFGFIVRSNFRESPVLAEYLNQQHMGIQIDEEAFVQGDWEAPVMRLLDYPRRPPAAVNGADKIAQFLETKCLIAT